MMAISKSLSQKMLTRDQVRRCDQIAIERFGINGLVLMENAGLAAAEVIFGLVTAMTPKRVCIVAGAGNNAGDGFVVARHLTNQAVRVDVLLCAPREKYQGDALSNLVILERMGLPIYPLGDKPADEVAATVTKFGQQAALVVDALLGTGANGPPRQPFHSAILAINALGKPVVALDIPSGLDCDTGLPLEVAVKANHTITFAAMKWGFTHPGAAAYTGQVQVASIGINTDWLMGTL